ncbi:MAG TPA: carotenoid biosynthesis protein [Anaerolineales bacterium]|nr:carotenoid biosynthesis protein [Anaerolineales bacterium]
MPNPYFVLFEIIIYVQLALCLRHAWKGGMANLLRLLAGIIFGVTLELATIRQLDAYEYGRFLIMVLDVPLCIGVAWSCILYSVMEFSEASSLPYWTRPILDGLLALNIDLALDAIAIRLGFWDWGRGLDFHYFGVPYPNFWAWFWVVFSFSFGYRLFARRTDWMKTWLAPLSALIVGLAGVLGTNAFIVFILPSSVRTPTVVFTLIVAFIIVFALRPRFYQTAIPWLVFWVPMLTHVYALFAGFVSGVILAPPFLLYMSMAMIGAALYIHRPAIEIIPFASRDQTR